MKIIITGSSGFVGKNLKSYFESIQELYSLSVRYHPQQHFKLDGYAIIHAAGKAHDLKNVSNAKAYYDSNFELTKQLFDAFLESSLAVFIFMSSVKAAADDVKGILTEETKVKPKTHYGLSKRQAEEYINSKKLPEGKRVYILRPCMIYGSGNRGNLNLLYNLVSKGIPWPLGSFENQRSFCSIENVCFVINEIIENEGIPSGIYNLADNESISTNKLISLIANAKDKKLRILNIPRGVISGIAIIGDFLKLPLNSERLQKLTESYVVSNEKIVKAIGKPLPYTAEEGLLKTFNSFKFNQL
nr:NAD-dependent epimerase/dehydratase family protein [uncultured Flavobacterium sp.]